MRARVQMDSSANRQYGAGYLQLVALRRSLGLVGRHGVLHSSMTTLSRFQCVWRFGQRSIARLHILAMTMFMFKLTWVHRYHFVRW